MKRLFKILGINDEFDTFFQWQKGKNSKYIAVSNSEKLVNIYDKYGNQVDLLSLTGNCTGLDWNLNGDLLAIICDQSPCLKIWDINNLKTKNISLNIKENLCSLFWSIKSSNLLAIATTKGNFLIYDVNTSRKIPILGKHSKKILTGCWTEDNLLFLVCEDNLMSVSNEKGDTIYQANLKENACLIKTSSNQLIFEKLTQETTFCVSIVLNNKQIIIFPCNDLNKHFSIDFKDTYDKIIDYFWISEDKIVVAFVNGYMSCTQIKRDQTNIELASIKPFSNLIQQISVCETTNYLSVIQENKIKFFDTNTFEQIENVIVIEDELELTRSEWSTNGQLLAALSDKNNLIIYLIKMPKLSSSFRNKIAFLSSLLELSYIDLDQERIENNLENKIQLEIEPSVIAIGATHVVAGINNKAFFYEIKPFFNVIKEEIDLVKDKEYTNIIKEIYLNDQYCAVLFTNKSVLLHLIPQYELEGSIAKNSLYNNDKLNIIAIALTNSFLIFSTEENYIEIFSIEEWNSVLIYRHQHPVKKIFPNLIGLKILLIDARNEAFIFNAVNEELILIDYSFKKDDDEELFLIYKNLNTDNVVAGQRNNTQSFPIKITKILWDISEKNIFVAVDKKKVYVYCLITKSIQKSFVQLVGTSLLPNDVRPELLNNGLIYYQTNNCFINYLQLETHSFSMSNKIKLNSSDVQKKKFHSLLKLRRFEDCWNFCENNENLDFWLQFINCCLHDLNLKDALKIARFIGHIGIVWSIKSIINIEEFNLLAGHVAMFLKWFDLAENFYLNSTQPKYALKLSYDLMDWNKCLVLAKRLSKDQLPFIHKQQATNLEFEEDFVKALEHYKSSLIQEERDDVEENILLQHNEECFAGISRCLLKTNEFKKGFNIALKLNDKKLIKKIASVFEESNLLNESSFLYEKAEKYENACLIHLKLRNLSKVKEILENQLLNENKLLKKEKLKKIFIQFAKLLEQEKNYLEAIKNYEQADQNLDCIRIYLNNLNRPEEAVRIFNYQKTTEAALLIANYYLSVNDFESAIEFLVFSNQFEEAFEIAIQESKMSLYADSILNFIFNKFDMNLNLKKNNLTDLNLDLLDKNLFRKLEQIATYYKEEKNFFQCGKFYCISSQYQKGIDFLLQSHNKNKFKPKIDEKEDALKLAIEFACKTNDRKIIQQVIEVLLNELDSDQNNFKYLFSLYMCSGQFREATKTSLFLAKAEQTNGSYDTAYNILIDMSKNLLSKSLKISFELLSALHLLHCYRLAKIFLKYENLDLSCELLIKVSNNINKFPKHAAQILSTTIIQCIKVGKKKKAIDLSTILLQNNNYQTQLDKNFRKKIENLIRKSATKKLENSLEEKNDEKQSLCPFCNELVANLQLSCNSCRNVMPFSILTCYHLTNKENYICKNCYLPFSTEELDTFLKFDKHCPVCNEILDKESVSKMKSLKIVF